MKKHYAYDEETFKMKDKSGAEYTLEIRYDEMPQDPRDWDNLCEMICWHRHYSLGDSHSFSDEWDFLRHLCEKVLGMEYEVCEDMTEKGLFKMLVDSGELVIKPIRLYEHSGITVSTSNGYPYNDRWDSCCVGFIYVTKERIFKERCSLCAKDENGNPILIEHKHDGAPSTYSYQRIPTTEENWKEVADQCIEGEMDTYDQYVRGDVYGYILTRKVLKQEKCPHCGEVIREYEEDEEVDSCWGFYGDCLEENGVLDNISADLEFVED